MIKRLLVLGVLVALASCVGCGQDDPQESPADSIATVGSVEIPRAELDRRVRLAMHRVAGQPAATRRHLRRVATSTVAQALIEGEWIEQEAQRKGVAVKKGARRSEDRLALLQRRLLAAEHASEPSNREIEDYFEAHRSLYAQPARREIQLVSLGSAAAAARVKAALAGGSTWRTVARRYPRRYRGRVETMRADLPAALGAAVFAAPTGRLSGPVHSSLGWSVFEVVAVMPAVAPALERARQTIASILGDRRANATRERWYRALRARYRPLTRCSEEIRLPSCSAPGAS